MLTFAELTGLIGEKGLWVHLRTDMNICLIGVKDQEKQVFEAKFLPCARNSRVYDIEYSKIESLTKPKQVEEL